MSDPSWAQVLVALIGMAATAIWVVASVRTTTAVLAEQILGLSREVERLRQSIEHADLRQRDLERRVDEMGATLDAHVGNGNCAS